MGWGQEPHEGYHDEKWPDGRWSGPTHRGGDPDAVAFQAVCSCGWRSEREHRVSPRPADAPKDERGLTYGPSWDAWLAEIETAEQQCWEDWNAEHFQPLLGYEPHSQLILAHTDGGARHFSTDARHTRGPSSNCCSTTATGYRSATSGAGRPTRPRPPRSRSGCRGLPEKSPSRTVDWLVNDVSSAGRGQLKLPPRAILRWPEHQ